MKTYKIAGQRTEYYEFEVSADTEEQAIREAKHIENFGDLSSHLITFDGMEITLVEEVVD